MKQIWLQVRSNRSRLSNWGRLFSGFAIVQLFVQAINAVSGLLLVHSFDKPAYAWFTIATGASAALIMIADSGLSTAVTSVGSEVWQDRAKLSRLVLEAFRQRLRMVAYAIALIVPVSTYLLQRNGAPLLESFALTAIATAPILFVSTTGILTVVNRLHSQSRSLQVADILQALTRLALTGLLILSGFATPFSVLSAVLVAFAFQTWLVRKQTRRILGEPSDDPGDFPGRIRRTIRQVYPNVLFTCVQGQLAIWLISLSGSIEKVADYGALARLGVLFLLLGAPVMQAIVPAFARSTQPRQLAGIGFGTVIGFIGCSSVFFLVALLFPTALLFILGNKYLHLETELPVVIAGMSLVSLSGLVWMFNSAKGWLSSLWVNIPLTLSVQGVFLLFKPVDSVMALAWFVIAYGSAQAIHSLVVFTAGTARVFRADKDSTR